MTPTIHQRRAWERVQVLLMDCGKYIPNSDFAKLISLPAHPADFTDDDIDDATLIFDTYGVRA